MADVAKVGIQIQTNGAQQATADLNKVAAATEQVAESTDRVSAAQSRARKAGNAAAEGYQKVSDAQRRFRNTSQNVSFQLQDIIVQLTAGTSVSRTLGQQLPQLASGFGAMGAGIGVALAALGALGTLLFDSGNDADDMAVKVLDLDEAMKKLVKSTQEANRQLERIRTGLSNEELDALASIKAAERRIIDLQSQAGVGGGLDDPLGVGVAGTLDAQVVAAREEIAKANEALEAAKKARDELAFARAAENVKGKFTNDVAAQQEARFKAAEKRVEEARKAAERADKDRLKAADVVRKALEKAEADHLKKMQKLRSGVEGQFTQDAFEAQKTRFDNAVKAAADRERLAEQEARAVEKYQRQEDRAVEKSLEAFRKLERAAVSLGEVLEFSLNRATDPFFDFIEGTKSVGDAFREMANSIISDISRIILQDSVTQPLAKAGSGILSTLLGGLTSSFGGPTPGIATTPGLTGPEAFANFPKAAKGTVLGGPSMVIAGEAGAEAILPLRRGSDGSLGVSGGGGSRVVVNITNESGGEVESRQSADGVDILIKRAVAGDISSGGPVFHAIRKTFAIGPALGSRG